MSSIGYYRYKTVPTENETVELYINNILTASKTITVKDICTDDVILKYLDKKGQYRFFPFNRFYEINDKPKLLGKTNKIIESVLDSQSSTSNIGYRNERTWALKAESVSNEELLILSDIYTSPRVYMLIGAADSLQDWLEVEVKKGSSVKPRKKKFTDIELDIILPEWYTIKMI